MLFGGICVVANTATVFDGDCVVVETASAFWW